MLSIISIQKTMQVYDNNYKMSRLQLQVISLKRKVKDLEEEITDRTRNYLLHIQTTKKGIQSPFQKKQITPIIQETDQNQLIKTLKEQIRQLGDQNIIYLDEINQKDRTISTLRQELESLKVQEVLQKAKDIPCQEQTLATNTKLLQQVQKTSKLIDEFEERIKSNSQTIAKLTNQIASEKSKSSLKIKQLLSEKEILEQSVNQLKFANENLSRRSLKNGDEVKVLEEKNLALESKVNVIREEINQIEMIVTDLNKQISSLKQKYYAEIIRGNEKMEEVNNFRLLLNSREKVIKQLESEKQKLFEVTQNHSPVPLSASKSTKQTETNTEGSKQKKVHIIEPTSNHQDEELLKLNDQLNEELVKKSEEYKRLLFKIDETEKQNNKLIGKTESLQRDLNYEREAQKIINQNIHEQKKVIQNQKNTIKTMEQKYQTEVARLQFSIEQLNQKKQKNLFNNEVNPMTPHSIYKHINDLNQLDSRGKLNNFDAFEVESQGKSPVVSVTEEPEKEKGLACSFDQINISRHKKIETSPFGDAEKYNIDKFGLDKKFSSYTSEGMKRSQEFQMKTPPIKSSRISTPSDLKNNIKNILDNTPLLGKGIQFIELVVSVLKQIESYSGPSYQDILQDLEKKKEVQKSAFHSTFMKQITEITKIKQECSEAIEQVRQDYEQKLKERQQYIIELKQQTHKQQSTSELLEEKIKHLESDLEKSKKLQSQKDIVSKTSMSKNSEKQEIDKLKQENNILIQKIQKYQVYVQQSQTVKQKILKENQKQRVQILFLKGEFKRTEEWVHKIQTLDKNNLDRVNREIDQVLDIFVSEKLQSQNKRRQAVLQLKDKQQILSKMAQQIDELKVEVKKRQSDLVQILEQVALIRSQNQQSEQEGESLGFYKQQQAQLRQQLKQKQQTFNMLEKELSRHRNQILVLNRQLDQERERNKIHNKQKRQLSNQISRLSITIEASERKLAYATQEQSYFFQKSSNEFEEIMEKMFFIKKKQKQNKVRTRSNSNSNMYKSISSTKLEHEGTHAERAVKENKDLKQFLKHLTQDIYAAYTALPHTSQSAPLFEAQNREQLLSQVKDVKRFAEEYNSLKSSLEGKQQIYLGLIKEIAKGSENIDENYINKSIDEMKIEQASQLSLKESVSSVFSFKSTIVANRSNTKKTSIEPIQ